MSTLCDLYAGSVFLVGKLFLIRTWTFSTAALLKGWDGASMSRFGATVPIGSLTLFRDHIRDQRECFVVTDLDIHILQRHDANRAGIAARERVDKDVHP